MLKLTDITLAALIVSENETIRRNAMSILKQLQREQVNAIADKYANCPKCGKPRDCEALLCNSCTP